MNEKEIGEIRRRFKTDKNNISTIIGCFVNEKNEIVSSVQQSLALMPQDESEKVLALLKKTLSGTHQKNLLDINFETQQVVNSPEHSMLMKLRNSALKDEEGIKIFIEKIIESVTIEGSYVILMAHDKYDVPYKSKDGEYGDFSGADSEDIFSYFVCGICPIKNTKEALTYHVYENAFHTLPADIVIAPPTMGFMFPAFDDRCANIYGALYYTKDTAHTQEMFIKNIFNTELPMPADAQKEVFETILEESLQSDCNLETVQQVREQLCEMIEEHKVNKEIEPLVITKQVMEGILISSGVEQSQVEVFGAKFDNDFGENTSVSPKNIMDTKQLQVKTPSVTIKIDPNRSDLLETRVINGVKYIMIKAEEDVQVNGINIKIMDNE